MTSSLGDSLVTALVRVVGDGQVLVDPELRSSYEIDWTGRFSGPSRAVVRPGSATEVARVLAICNEAGVPVVPQGGNTGLVGGSVPRSVPAGTGERPATGAAESTPIVLSLRRLTGAVEVDDTNLLLRAGAGTTLAAAAEAAGTAGLEIGVDLAARDSATLGGMVATNAGGMHVIRHGSMRRRLVGIEAALPDGSVLRRMEGLWKDNVGWDLASLLAGSEGTLAVVTAVALRLVPRPAQRVTALVAISPGSPGLRSAVGAALELLARLRRDVDGLEAVEIVDREAMDLVTSHAGLPAAPGDDSTSAWLLVEAGGSSDPTDALAAALDHPAAGEVAVATDTAGRRHLWAYRERIAEAIAGLGVPHKLDLSVPVGVLPELLGAVGTVVAGVAPGAGVVRFGHLGDGNAHVNVLGPPPEDMSVDDAVLRYALSLGGSISAEHGIGIAKLRALPWARSSAELELARRVKSAFDPNTILNPGVLGLP